MRSSAVGSTSHGEEDLVGPEPGPVGLVGAGDEQVGGAGEARAEPDLRALPDHEVVGNLPGQRRPDHAEEGALVGHGGDGSRHVSPRWSSSAALRLLGSPAVPLHLHGPVLDGSGDDEPRDLWVTADGLLTHEAIAGADRIDGWILPGLVDAHCHVGIGPDGPVELEEARAQGHTDAAAGALLVRDCGSPIDTRPLDDDPAMPEIVRAGRHLARPKRYIRGLPIDVETPPSCPASSTSRPGTTRG